VTIRALLLQRCVVGSRVGIPGRGRGEGGESGENRRRRRNFLRAKISAPNGIKRPFSLHGAYTSRHACAHTREERGEYRMRLRSSLHGGSPPPWTAPGDSHYPPA